MDGGEVSEADGGKQEREARGGEGLLGWKLLRKRGPGAFRLACSGGGAPGAVRVTLTLISA